MLGIVCVVRVCEFIVSSVVVSVDVSWRCVCVVIVFEIFGIWFMLFEIEVRLYNIVCFSGFCYSCFIEM